jgi:thymidylate synthase (FAD)
MEDAWALYSRLVEEGVPEEDARYVLPNAAHTNIVVTMNARELIHFFSLRTCLRAQWEIRKVAGAMLKEAKAVAPLIFENAGRPCLRGPCPEEDVDCPLYPGSRGPQEGGGDTV